MVVVVMVVVVVVVVLVVVTVLLVPVTFSKDSTSTWGSMGNTTIAKIHKNT